MIKFERFQRQDLARAALHDGLILSWDTGLGKTWALFIWALLKIGWDIFPFAVDGRVILKPKKPVLIIAPGDLHQQIADEGWNRFRIKVVPLPDQETFMRLARSPHSALMNLDDDGRPVLPPDYYITSYTQLTSNGVASLPDPDDWDPHALLKFLCLKIGEHRKLVRIGDPLPITGEEDRKVCLWKDHPEMEDVCHFYAWRGLCWGHEFNKLLLDPNSCWADLQQAYRRELEACEYMRDPVAAGKERGKVEEAYAILKNLIPTVGGPKFAEATFARLTDEQQHFVIREFCKLKLKDYSLHLGELHPLGGPVDPTKAIIEKSLAEEAPPLPGGEGRGEGDVAHRKVWRVKCVYSPSLADLAYNAFEAVVIDEGVKMKGEETIVGKGVRSMDARFRLVLTASPIKNRLPDIFRLAWWASGGKSEAHARWPYADDSSERTKFAETFMVSERNLTREAKAEERGESVGNRFKKLTAEVCNVHRLWKLLGPVLLRRRKEDTGVDIVPRIRKVIRCEMGTFQQQVYRYHLEGCYIDRNGMKAVGAQLQALRMAAADPASEHLSPVGSDARVDCPECKGSLEKREECRRCGRTGHLPLPHRSGTAYIPKMATALTLIKEILQRKEQVVVFSAFTDPLDNLARWLNEANVRHVKLDGRTSQKARGKMAAVFKRGRVADPQVPSAIPVMLAGVECMAEGHSFHLANNVILIAYSWAYDKFIQAIARVHRMTSTKPVNVYVVLCEGTIDRKLESLILDKGDAAELVLDGRLIGERTEEVNLGELLRVARQEFDDKIKTIDEAELYAQWPALRTDLTNAMLDWDNADGVPIGTAVQAEPRTAAVPSRGGPPQGVQTSAGGSPQGPDAELDNWRERMRARARQTANNARVNPWDCL